MNTKILTIFTRTPLHVGCGSSVGAVDQPVTRERHTGYPTIPGSSIKGVLADLWNENEIRNEDGVRIFGKTDTEDAGAGHVAFGEAKLLAFPVRSAKGCFAFITCPLALKRFKRDSAQAFDIPAPGNDKLLIANAAKDVLTLEGKTAILEEYPFEVEFLNNPDLFKALQPLCDDDIWSNLSSRLAIVSDGYFKYFAENTCEIAQHNRIDDRTGVVDDKALFNQENVPSETLFYSVFHSISRSDLSGFDPFPLLEEKLRGESNLLQIGADITTGLGWCSVKFI